MFDDLNEKAYQDFEARHQVREIALKNTRQLTRRAANAIRAIPEANWWETSDATAP